MDEVVEPRQKAHHSEKMEEIIAREHCNEPENEEYFEVHSPVQLDTWIRRADTNEEEQVDSYDSKIIQPRVVYAKN